MTAMRLVPLLALCLAAPLAAQIPDPTPPESYVPLAVGNVWEYATTQTGPKRGWRVQVVADTTIGGLRYAVVRTRVYTAPTALYSDTREAVRYQPEAGFVRRADGTHPAFLLAYPDPACRLDLPFGEPGTFPGCSFANPVPLAGGGLGQSVPVGGGPRAVKSLLGGLGYDQTFAAGIGLTLSGRDTFEPIVLRYARIDGVEYGSHVGALPPAAPEPSAYWPLAVGNTWVTRYDVLEPRYEWQVVRAAVVVSDTSYASVERCTRYDGATPTCGTALVRVDDRTGKIYERVGDGETVIMCGLLPTAESGPLACDLMGLATWELTSQAPTTIQIGTATVSTPSLRTVSVPDFSMSYAAGIGPLPTAGLTGVGTFVYVRIGGAEYGVNPVAGEGTPSSPALALRVAPNPADGPVTLAVLGAASPVFVEAFDALGRRVWRGSVVGSATVDARGWAPGVYVLRATAGDATATTRLVRR